MGFCEKKQHTFGCIKRELKSTFFWGTKKSISRRALQDFLLCTLSQIFSHCTFSIFVDQPTLKTFKRRRESKKGHKVLLNSWSLKNVNPTAASYQFFIPSSKIFHWCKFYANKNVNFLHIRKGKTHLLIWSFFFALGKNSASILINWPITF